MSRPLVHVYLDDSKTKAAAGQPLNAGISGAAALRELEKANGPGNLKDPAGIFVSSDDQNLPEGDYVFISAGLQGPGTAGAAGLQGPGTAGAAGSQPPGTAGIAGQSSHTREEVDLMMAFIKQQMDIAQSVRLSAIEPGQFSLICKKAGLRFQQSSGIAELGLKREPVQPYAWQASAESSQSSLYLPYIKERLLFDEADYVLYDARRHSQWLTVEGHQDELGFNIRGTTDVALVVKQALGVGLPRVGIKWLWELKKDLGGRQEQDSPHNFEEASEAHGSIQAIVSLLLANIHSPDQQPGLTLTDLQGSHKLFWMDGNTVIYHDAPNAASAWALTSSFLHVHETLINAGGQASLSSAEKHVMKRQRLDLGRALAGTEAEKMADLEGMLGQSDDDEIRASQAACLLRQLLNTPALARPAGLARPPPEIMYT